MAGAVAGLRVVELGEGKAVAWTAFVDGLGNPEWAQDPVIRNLGDPQVRRSLAIEDGEHAKCVLRDGRGRLRGPRAAMAHSEALDEHTLANTLRCPQADFELPLGSRSFCIYTCELHEGLAKLLPSTALGLPLRSRARGRGTGTVAAPRPRRGAAAAGGRGRVAARLRSALPQLPRRLQPPRERAHRRAARRRRRHATPRRARHGRLQPALERQRLRRCRRRLRAGRLHDRCLLPRRGRHGRRAQPLGEQRPGDRRLGRAPVRGARPRGAARAAAADLGPAARARLPHREGRGAALRGLPAVAAQPAVLRRDGRPRAADRPRLLDAPDYPGATSGSAARAP